MGHTGGTSCDSRSNKSNYGFLLRFAKTKKTPVIVRPASKWNNPPGFRLLDSASRTKSFLQVSKGPRWRSAGCVPPAPAASWASSRSDTLTSRPPRLRGMGGPGDGGPKGEVMSPKCCPQPTNGLPSRRDSESQVTKRLRKLQFGWVSTNTPSQPSPASQPADQLMKASFLHSLK